MTEARPALDEWRHFYGRVGVLLFDNRLEPTPENYALAHRYVSAGDSEFNEIVDRAIAQGGGLTASALTGILAERDAELSATDLSRMADEAQAFLDQIAAIVGRSSDDAKGYGEALSVEAADLAAGASPVRAVESLIGLTRAMIGKTRVAEDHLRRTGTEIAALRGELATARHSANSDVLTGLPNRRAMDEKLRKTIETAHRTGRPLSLAICDIDHFKRFNDLHGHQIGDEVVKFVACTLARETGDDHFVARYGGEEFVLLFDGLEASAAGAEADRLRVIVSGRELKISATGKPLGRLSLSAGVAGLEEIDSPATLMKRADAALYQAKHAGRDRVCIAAQKD